MLKQEQAAYQIIQEQLSQVSKPAVACSFGKDSMVLLYLVREQLPNVPVLYCPHFDDPVKHAYVAEIVTQWQLNIQPVLPSFRAVYELDDWIEMVDVVEPAPGHFLWLTIDPDRSAPPGETPICGMDAIDKVEPQPPGNFDAIFTGQRQQDFDTMFPWPASVPAITINNGWRLISPLTDWTDLDIWDAIDRHSIPYNRQRYDHRNRSANNDTWNLCTSCMGTDNSVHCPQVDAEIPGVRSLLDIDERTAHFANLTRK